MNDADLLREYARNQSEAAFRELVSKYVDLVYSAALRQSGGDPHAAQEITQMVFIDLAKKAPRLLGHPLLVAWLHRSTRWAGSNQRRAERRRRLRNESLALDPELGAQNEAPLDWAQLRPLLDEALDELGEQEREAVLLRYFQNQSNEALAAQFSISANTARMRVTRALEKLQVALSRRGISSTSAALGLALSQYSVGAAPASLAGSVSSLALAKAGAAGFSLTMLTNFFLMTKVQVGIVSAVLLLSGGLCALSLQGRSSRQEKLAGLEAHNRSLVAQISAAKERREQLDKQLTSLQARVADSGNPTQQQRFRLDLVIRKGQLDYAWASLFKKLRLSPAQLDAFKALLVERDQAIYDAAQLAKKQGLEELLPSERERFHLLATSQVDEGIRALLGSAGFESFRLFEHSGQFQGLLELAVPPKSLSALREQNSDWYAETTSKLSQLLRAELPDYLDRCYLANEGVPVPPEFLQKAQALCPPDYGSAAHLSDYNTRIALNAQINAIERKAAAEGRLYLLKDSAKAYGVDVKPAPRRDTGKATP